MNPRVKIAKRGHKLEILVSDVNGKAVDLAKYAESATIRFDAGEVPRFETVIPVGQIEMDLDLPAGVVVVKEKEASA